MKVKNLYQQLQNIVSDLLMAQFSVFYGHASSSIYLYV